MWGTSIRSICSIDVEGDRPRVLYLWSMDLSQLLRILVLQNIELSMNITNIVLSIYMQMHPQYTIQPLSCCEPFEPRSDRQVTKLFHCHFCANNGSIFVYHFYVFGSTVMHTFSIVLVLLSEQYVVPFTHINLLVVHIKTGNNLLWLVQVFWHVVFH
jgi:hypothetical protein